MGQHFLYIAVDLGRETMKMVREIEVRISEVCRTDRLGKTLTVNLAIALVVGTTVKVTQ